MYKKALMIKSIDVIICDIEKKHDLFFLKYRFVEKFVNAIQSHKKILAKTTFWNWHLRLKHCRSEMINQRKTIDKIEIIKKNASKIVQCDTCAILKMHRLIQRTSSAKAIQFFQMLHFDLIICNKTFNDTTCIAHFIDELIFYSWVYSLINHKKKTLLSIFKNLINQCDRMRFNERAIIRIIRIDQKSSSIKSLKTEYARKKLIEINRRRIFLNRTKNLNVLMNYWSKKQNASKNIRKCRNICTQNVISSLRTYWIERRRQFWAETSHWYLCKSWWKNQFDMRLLISKCLIAKRSHFLKKQMHSKKWKDEISSIHRIFDKIWLNQYLLNLKFKERRRKWLSRRHIQWNELFRHVRNNQSLQERRKKVLCNVSCDFAADIWEQRWKVIRQNINTKTRIT
jgi:hypothetical protein